MPRKTSKVWHHCQGRSRCFNEAAARCRGKLSTAVTRRSAAARFNEAAARCRGKRERRGRGDADGDASMRPRPDAAENRRRPAVQPRRRTGFNEAAARCRGKLAVRRAPGQIDDVASMRPRPDAAENFVRISHCQVSVRASMRPRPDAAENTRDRRRGRAGPRRFNEAAARCRGKRASPPTALAGGRGFNEAAARCRGKRTRPARRTPAARPASMRPRPDAAENRRSARGGFGRA